ncbi:MAG: NAD(P)/FAD-dependent oxidoreductase [Clostridia bacterium]|nr:NAD(P)/FAD-dependent oxidoreductase [Clostridia bacterium]
MSKKEKSVIIIGAGLAGLAAGCYSQMNGYNTKIVEMHFIPGGCCTSWDRGDYTFDWCIMWMLGTAPGNEMNQIWNELGALQGKKIVDFDIFNNVKGLDGQTVSFYVNPDRLESHLKGISPEDKEPIEAFCRSLKEFRKCIDAYPFLKPVNMMSIPERLKMFLSFWKHGKLIKTSHETLMDDFSKRFKHPLLREAFNYIFFDRHPTFPLLPYYFNVACATDKNAGCPEGGSIGVAQSIEKRFKELGGEIQYRAKVTKILVENDRAVGVKLADGTEHRADIVISACDGRTTIFDMLGGKYVNDTLNKVYNNLIDEPDMTYPSWMSVFLGVKRDFKGEPHSTTYLLSDAEAARIPGSMDKSMLVQFRNMHYPECAPEGKSVILACAFSDYNHWAKLHKNKKAYKEEKKKLGQFVIEYLDRIYPGLKDQVEQIDVSTPTTIVRYTGSYKGSVMAWDPFNKAADTIEEFAGKHGMKLPGLKNFYMTGQWMSTGGVIRAVTTGRHVMQFVCKDDGRKFKAHTDCVGQYVEGKEALGI